jgi:predicted RecB family nuclease
MKQKSKLKTCKNGHTFYKNSDCPFCPACEEERKSNDISFSVLAAPARRALENNGIKTVEKLSNFNEKEILGFHGMGKSSIPKLVALMKEKNLKFKP